MKFANDVKTYRKSGVAEGRDLRCAIRVPRPHRPTRRRNTALKPRIGELKYPIDTVC
jgi:hypothetical protein